MIRFNSLVRYLLSIVALYAGTATAEQPARQQKPSWVRPRLVGTASDSGGFSLDEPKLRGLFPEFKWTADQIAYLDEHLALGDSRAAIVASVDPLVVSAYSDELDAVILVQFPDALVKQYALDVGDQLIASWIYPKSRQPPSDILQGKNNLGRHTNGVPIVADFFSDSVEKIKKRKSAISTAEWERVRTLTPAALKRADGKHRSSFPLDVRLPPELLDALSVEE